MSIETIAQGEPAEEYFGMLDAVLDNMYEYPEERGTNVALRFAIAMSKLSEYSRTRPLGDIVAEDRGVRLGVGEATFAATLAIAAELGSFESQPYIPEQPSATTVDKVA